MTVTVQRAKSLCNSSEMALVMASTSKRIEGLSEAQLRQKIARARKLRDKFRGLADRQKREVRGKGTSRGAPKAQDNRNTRTKQQLFAETLERFEAALAAKSDRGAAKKKVAKKRVSKKKPAARTAGVNTKKKTAGTKSTAKKSALRKKARAVKAMRKKAHRAKSTKKVGTSRGPLDTPEARARDLTLRKSSKRSQGKRKAKQVDASGHVRHIYGVAGHTKRVQAKRDSVN